LGTFITRKPSDSPQIFPHCV